MKVKTETAQSRVTQIEKNVQPETVKGKRLIKIMTTCLIFTSN